ncbi:DUF2213 domain-containing protein [Robbsia andropogonis]|uniref:DUF2213 domain-containing protein n=1 Tax=Robbsia andropogonis TaxID=28092 RepID=UPI000463274C|nr:DUF2213 domain-containing protein [Robbsia andropogonis]
MSHKCTCKASEKTHVHATTDSVTASGFFTTEKVGKRQSFTPEGFLLCEEVPIARIGTQDYAAIELPDLEDKDGVIEVERTEDVVFSPATIASFIGKPVTIDHPSEAVTPTTWGVLAKGGVHNVRRGAGDMSDFLIADLLVTDRGAINDVVSGRLTQVSCGYDSDYEQIAPGRARQTTVVGNHVALVLNARCGPVCAITADSSHLPSYEANMPVTKPAQQSATIADKLRKFFMTRDSDEFEKTLAEVDGADDSGDKESGQHIHIHMPSDKPAEVKAETTDEDDPADAVLAAIQGLSGKFDALSARVEALENPGNTETVDEDPDDDSEGDMTTDEDSGAKPESKPVATGDSASLRAEFQLAKSRAEILAPGVKLPTFDAKLTAKKTSDSLCVLRRRALRAALENDNADLVSSVIGDADVSKMTCDSARAFFNASAELVKQKNATRYSGVGTGDSPKSTFADINKINAAFWANRT